jgi:uncharacterized iron-regulated membrane protein
MARNRLMLRFARWHIWLGWVVALPVLMWLITGLVMVARPNEEVRGEHLRAAPAAMDGGDIAFPELRDRIREARLVRQPDGPVWIVVAADGRRWRYSAGGGGAIPPVIEDEARRIAESAYAGEAALEAVAYLPDDEVPREAGTSASAWQARFADGARVYIDDATGEVTALRTGQWRLYDFMWGLHIMDPATREDTHNPFVIVFSLLALAGALLGTVLLFRRRKARVKT